MKLNTIFTLILSFVIIPLSFSIIGCSSGSSGGDPQSSPVISDVKLFNSKYPETATTSFEAIDSLAYSVFASDPDLDIKELSVSIYNQSNDALYAGPNITPVTAHEEADIKIEGDALALKGMSGKYKIEFELADEKGNRSSVFLRMIYVSMTTFVSNDDETVTDTRNNFMWQNSTTLSKRTWDEAKAYCDALVLADNGDWRLPEDDILHELWHSNDRPPHIANAFNCHSDGYWSITESANGQSAYIVDFGSRSYSAPIERRKDAKYYVRCIRADSIDDDGDGFSENQGDCDDSSKDAFPGGIEVCGDNIDQDCSGTDLGCDEVDDDGDGFTDIEGDCDDTSPEIYPDAPEICGDEIDQDCNGKDLSCDDVDDDEDGYTENQGDCDDTNAKIYPGAEEVCGDNIDQDCSGSDLSCKEVDNDEDGYTENQGDCDDTNPAIHPGAVEIAGDSIDQDCNGEDMLGPNDIDDDKDGFTENQGDCNDADATIHPEAKEICGDGIDQDCKDGDLTCSADPGADQDNDSDGYTENNGDCDDTDLTIYPNAPEVCGDGIDQDCDGSDLACSETNDATDDTTDAATDDTTDDKPVVENDGDGDGFPAETDCNDSNPAIHPGALDLCGDDIDTNCDGVDCQLRCDYSPQDLDGDCWPNELDCDNSDYFTYPGAPQLKGDGKDNSCGLLPYNPFTDR